MMLLHDPSSLPTATRLAVEDLKARYRFFFIPSVNPDGYQNGTYGNAAGVSVSENFDYNWTAGNHTPGHAEYRGPSPFSEPESRHVRDAILSNEPVSVLCLHTWGSSSVGYMTRRPRNIYDDATMLEMWESVNTALGYGESFTKRRESSLPSGSAYNWAGTLTSPAARSIIAQVWESGGGMTVQDQSRVGMTGILYHMLMVDSMLSAASGKPSGLVDSWGPVVIDQRKHVVTSVSLMLNDRLSEVWRSG